MATQHPDNASEPFFQSSPFLSTSQEIDECYLNFSQLKIDEYNWDWEGKFVDEAVVDRFLQKRNKFFSRYQLGKDKFLTFRFPNPRIEKQFRLARAFMVIITTSQLARDLGFTKAPIFEAILPLCESAGEIIDIQDAFRNLIGVKHRLLYNKNSINHIEIIPLFEKVSTMMSAVSLLGRYIKMHKRKFGFVPSYIRPYCARSDPALNSGLVPTVLGIKVALSSYIKLSQSTGVRLYPILGTGSLPFRGGLSPETVDRVLDEYGGISTYTVQSAFRYDYSPAKVKKAVAKIKKKIGCKKAMQLSVSQVRAIKKVLPLFRSPYRQTIEELAPFINKISIHIPKRRERVLHIGLFGYSRGVGKVRLPRAIPFTGSLYSIGVPPEFIGTGRGIKKALEKGLWSKVSPFYLHLKEELQQAGFFLNKKNVQLLKSKFSCFEGIAEDIKYIEKYLEINLGPQKPFHFQHLQISSKIYEKILDNKNISKLITQSGILRKSLG